MPPTAFLRRPDNTKLAYQHLQGTAPGILFCPGFNSDMQGNKAVALQAWCRQQGRQFTRFDCFGHGQCDEDVPWQHALTIAEQLRSGDVEVLLVKSGDHRLSEPEDMQRLTATVEQLL